MKLKYVLLLLVCLSGAHATGPDLPLRFQDERPAGRDWSTALLVDLARVTPPVITREIYRSGERIAAEKLPVKLSEKRKSDGPQRLELSLRPTSTSRLEDGAYAQKVVVEAGWRNNKENPPLHIERWFYFQVRDRSLVPLSPEEYERLTDSPQKESTGTGGLHYLGGDRAEAIPLSKTSRTQAVRADSVDRINEEPLPEAARRAEVREAKPDRSEEREP